MSENKYLQAKQEVSNILQSLLIGFIGGIILGAIFGYMVYTIDGELLHMIVMTLSMGIGFMGMPYLWSKLPNTISKYFFITIIWFIVKLWIAAIGGLLITSIALVVQLIKLYRYKPAE